MIELSNLKKGDELVRVWFTYDKEPVVADVKVTSITKRIIQCEFDSDRVRTVLYNRDTFISVETGEEFIAIKKQAKDKPKQSHIIGFSVDVIIRHTNDNGETQTEFGYYDIERDSWLIPGPDNESATPIEKSQIIYWCYIPEKFVMPH